MATSVGAGLAPAHDNESLVLALRPWRRRVFTQQTLRWFVRGAITGLLLVCLVLLLSRLMPWASALYWALGLGIASLLLTLAAALWYRPSIASTVRIIDQRLALHDRLGTAWELREQSSALVRLQRNDALTQLQKHTPEQAISLRQRRSTYVFCALLALGLILLLVLPNPMTAVIQQQAALHAQISLQVTAIEKLRQAIDQQKNISAPEKQQINQILTNLETKLQTAKSPTAAQQALSDAQSKLAQLSNPQTANQVQGQTAASTALQNSTNSSLKALGKALGSGNSKDLAQALQKLGRK